MLDIIVRFLFIIAAFITGLFMAQDELHFEIVRMVVAVSLFTLIILAIVFWPTIKGFISGSNKDKKK